MPHSIDQDASEVCSLGLNRAGEITYVEFWYKKAGYEVVDGNLVVKGTAYHGDSNGRLLVRGVFTPNDLEGLNLDFLDEKLTAAAKLAAKQLRAGLSPFPGYAKRKAELKRKFDQAPEEDKWQYMTSWDGGLIEGGEPALYVRLYASGRVYCRFSLGENGDGGEDWLEPMKSTKPVPPPAQSKSSTTTTTSPGTKAKP